MWRFCGVAHGNASGMNFRDDAPGGERANGPQRVLDIYLPATMATWRGSRCVLGRGLFQRSRSLWIRAGHRIGWRTAGSQAFLKAFKTSSSQAKVVLFPYAVIRPSGNAVALGTPNAGARRVRRRSSQEAHFLEWGRS